MLNNNRTFEMSTYMCPLVSIRVFLVKQKKSNNFELRSHILPCKLIIYIKQIRFHVEYLNNRYSIKLKLIVKERWSAGDLLLTEVRLGYRCWLCRHLADPETQCQHSSSNRRTRAPSLARPHCNLLVSRDAVRTVVECTQFRNNVLTA